MKKYSTILGIDPGVSGGLAVYSIYKQTIFAGKMPTYKIDTAKKTARGNFKKRTLTDVPILQDRLKDYKQEGNVICFIEKVQSHKSDTDENPGKRFQIDKMLANYESIKACLSLFDIDYVEVHPLSWQSYLNLKKLKGEQPKDRKNRYKEVAQQWFPTVKVNKAVADALIMCRFGFMKLNHDRDWVEQKKVGRQEGRLNL